MNRLIQSFTIPAIACIAVAAQSKTDMMENKFIISANSKELSATFADNSSASAFRDLLADGPLVVEMNDYGNFEKVGSLGHNLPTNDTRITTVPGDVILYLGSNITIYYDVNTWTFTSLGRIDGNPTRESILSVLGKGNTNVTFALENPSSGLSEVNSGTSVLEVHMAGRTLTVTKAPENFPISVYDSGGKSVYHGFSRKITLPDSGLYVVTCGDAHTRIMVK